MWGTGDGDGWGVAGFAGGGIYGCWRDGMGPERACTTRPAPAAIRASNSMLNLRVAVSHAPRMNAFGYLRA